jgi:hypothetical protein
VGEEEGEMECAGLFISAAMTFLIFSLPATFSPRLIHSPSPSPCKNGEQPLVQVEEPSPTVAQNAYRR